MKEYVIYSEFSHIITKCDKYWTKVPRFIPLGFNLAAALLDLTLRKIAN